jgi:hypothetical protein
VLRKYVYEDGSYKRCVEIKQSIVPNLAHGLLHRPLFEWGKSIKTIHPPIA